MHPFNEVKYNKTMEQRNLFIGNGFNLVEMWECQWCEFKNTLDNKEQLETNGNIQHGVPIHAHNAKNKINIHNGKVGKKNEQYYK